MSDSTNTRGIVSPALLGYGFFLAVLLFIGLLLARDALDRVGESRKRESEDRRALLLDRVMIGEDTGFPLANTLLPFLLAHRHGWGYAKSFENHRRNMRENYHCDLSYFLFQRGKPALVSHPADPRMRLVGRVLQGMVLSGKALLQEAAQLDPLLAAEWGRTATIAHFRKANGEYRLIRSRGNPALIIFDRYPDGRGLAILLENVPETVVREYLAHQRRESCLKPFTGHAIPEVGVWCPPGKKSVNEMRLAWIAWEKARTTSNQTSLRGGIEWRFERDCQGRVHCLVFKSVDDGSSAIFPLLVIAALLLFLWGLSLIQRLGAGQAPAEGFLSLKIQLRAVFLAVTLLPALSGIILGMIFLQDQEERVRNAAYSDGAARLRAIETGFPRTLGEIITKYRTLYALLSAHPVDPEFIRPMVDRLKDERILNYCLVFDNRFRVLFRNFDDSRNELVMMLDNLARVAVRRYTPHRLPAGEAERIKASDIVLEQVSSNEELGWSSLVENRDQMHSLRLGLGYSQLYWDLFPKLSTGPVFLACMNEFENIVQRYLNRRSDCGGGRSGLVSMDLHRWDVSPTVGTDEKTIRNLCVVAKKTGRGLHRQLRLASGTAWVVAVCESMMSQFGMAIVKDARKELDALVIYRIALGFGVFLALVMAVSAGRLLSSLVLVPIADLEEGIEAIRLRKTGTRVPERRMDEFGELAAVFNHTLAGLKELELARIVQMSLFPLHEPLISGYSLAAVNQPATDLGGDYYDLLTLEDGRLVMVLGDVTGHGASAALAMAMAKAAMMYRLEAGERTPKGLVDALNLVFFKELRGSRKFMTLVTGMFSPGEHRLKLENAGHNYPLFFKDSEKKSSFVQMIGLPLGVRKKADREGADLNFAPGDAIIFYTDGYTECLLPNGEQFGDDQFQVLVEKFCAEGLDAAAIRDRLLEVLHTVRMPGPMADDVTLVVLRRNRV
ncbi:MAG: SpoIIE family protein phosphatase [Candidatus Ozemobacteraceae bacterium]